MLEYKEKKAEDGPANALVIFVHGYGANGADLIGLADPLQPYLPKVDFVSPDAPTQIPNMGFAYEWFPIPWLDGSSEEDAEKGLRRATRLLNEFIDTLSFERNIPQNRIVLFGFSQGTMLSLHVGLRRKEALGGIVGFSGRLLAPETLGAEIQSKPPVFLAHGDMDDVVPPQDTPEAARVLEANGVDVAYHISPGVAHGIAPDGLTKALIALQAWIGQDAGE